MSEIKDNIVLAIETATRAGSVALARGSEVVAAISGDPSASHSIGLLQMVEVVLKRSRLKLTDVDLFAAALGPGSFTGLRIGLSTIKAFAASTGKSCAGVSTLAAIALAAGTSERTVSLLAAGRGELFVQSFSVRNDEVRELDEAAHLSLSEIFEKYGRAPELKWAGDGARQNSAALEGWAAEQAIPFGANLSGWNLAPATEQLASSIAALALKASVVGPNELRAVYVRASDAEINEKWQRQNQPESERR
jgi:tRNA threonylcarbamoyladenosine biosynthesis protein TsaB